MAKHLASVITLTLAITLNFSTSAFSQESFYKDKVIRIVVATAAGGGYDLYTRTMARHLRKYIPGEPTIVVENMPGAGHLIGANYVYKVAKPDGLTIGHFIGSLFLQQLLGKPGVEFDALKFNFIGVPAQDSYMIGLSKTTGITSMEQWLASKRILKIGGIGAGSATDDIPKVLAATIGLPLQVVAGYKGTSEVRLAFNSGEIEESATHGNPLNRHGARRWMGTKWRWFFRLSQPVIRMFRTCLWLSIMPRQTKRKG